jgi:hypothetical protein
LGAASKGINSIPALVCCLPCVVVTGAGRKRVQDHVNDAAR